MWKDSLCARSFAFFCKTNSIGIIHRMMFGFEQRSNCIITCYHHNDPHRHTISSCLFYFVFCFFISFLSSALLHCQSILIRLHNILCVEFLLVFTFSLCNKNPLCSKLKCHHASLGVHIFHSFSTSSSCFHIINWKWKR